jgi:hypothetical protein
VLAGVSYLRAVHVLCFIVYTSLMFLGKAPKTRITYPSLRVKKREGKAEKKRKLKNGLVVK